MVLRDESLGDHTRTLVSLEDALKDWVPPPKEEDLVPSAPSEQPEVEEDKGPGFSLAEARAHLERKHGKTMAISTVASMAPSRAVSRPESPGQGAATVGNEEGTQDALTKAAAALFALGRQASDSDKEDAEGIGGGDALLDFDGKKGLVFYKLKSWEKLCGAAIEATRLTDGYVMFKNWDCQACKDQLFLLRIKRLCTDSDLIRRKPRCRKCKRLLVWHQSFISLPLLEGGPNNGEDEEEEEEEVAGDSDDSENWEPVKLGLQSRRRSIAQQRRKSIAEDSLTKVLREVKEKNVQLSALPGAQAVDSVDEQRKREEAERLKQADTRHEFLENRRKIATGELSKEEVLSHEHMKRIGREQPAEHGHSTRQRHIPEPPAAPASRSSGAPLPESGSMKNSGEGRLSRVPSAEGGGRGGGGGGLSRAASTEGGSKGGARAPPSEEGFMSHSDRRQYEREQRRREKAENEARLQDQKEELRRQEEAERKAKRDAMLAKRGGVSRTASVESSSGVARAKKEEEERRREEEEEEERRREEEEEERRREEEEAEERRKEEEEQRRKEGLDALEAIVRERQAAAARANNRRQDAAGKEAARAAARDMMAEEERWQHKDMVHRRASLMGASNSPRRQSVIGKDASPDAPHSARRQSVIGEGASPDAELIRRRLQSLDETAGSSPDTSYTSLDRTADPSPERAGHEEHSPPRADYAHGPLRASCDRSVERAESERRRMEADAELMRLRRKAYAEMTAANGGGGHVRQPQVQGVKGEEGVLAIRPHQDVAAVQQKSQAGGLSLGRGASASEFLRSEPQQQHEEYGKGQVSNTRHKTGKAEHVTGYERGVNSPVAPWGDEPPSEAVPVLSSRGDAHRVSKTGKSGKSGVGDGGGGKSGGGREGGAHGKPVKTPRASANSVSAPLELHKASRGTNVGMWDDGSRLSPIDTPALDHAIAAPAPAIDSLSSAHDSVLSITRLKGKALDAANPMPAARSPRRDAAKANAGHGKETADDGSLAGLGADGGGNTGPKVGEGDGAHIASPSQSKADRFPPIPDRTRPKIDIEKVTWHGGKERGGNPPPPFSTPLDWKRIGLDPRGTSNPGMFAVFEGLHAIYGSVPYKIKPSFGSKEEHVHGTWQPGKKDGVWDQEVSRRRRAEEDEAQVLNMQKQAYREEQERKLRLQNEQALAQADAVNQAAAMGNIGLMKSPSKKQQQHSASPRKQQAIGRSASGGTGGGVLRVKDDYGEGALMGYDAREHAGVDMGAGRYKFESPRKARPGLVFGASPRRAGAGGVGVGKGVEGADTGIPTPPGKATGVPSQGSSRSRVEPSSRGWSIDGGEILNTCSERGSATSKGGLGIGFEGFEDEERGVAVSVGAGQGGVGVPSASRRERGSQPGASPGSPKVSAARGPVGGVEVSIKVESPKEHQTAPGRVGEMHRRVGDSWESRTDPYEGGADAILGNAGVPIIASKGADVFRGTRTKPRYAPRPPRQEKGSDHAAKRKNKSRLQGWDKEASTPWTPPSELPSAMGSPMRGHTAVNNLPEAIVKQPDVGVLQAPVVPQIELGWLPHKAPAGEGSEVMAEVKTKLLQAELGRNAIDIVAKARGSETDRQHRRRVSHAFRELRPGGLTAREGRAAGAKAVLGALSAQELEQVHAVAAKVGWRGGGKVKPVPKVDFRGPFGFTPRAAVLEWTEKKEEDPVASSHSVKSGAPTWPKRAAVPQNSEQAVSQW